MTKRGPQPSTFVPAGRILPGRMAQCSFMAKIRRALLSVTDKTAVAEFARGLSELGVELISTGGTYRE